MDEWLMLRWMIEIDKAETKHLDAIRHCNDQRLWRPLWFLYVRRLIIDEFGFGQASEGSNRAALKT